MDNDALEKALRDDAMDILSSPDSDVDERDFGKRIISAADEITRLTARVAELEANTIPKLPNCGKYRATDNTGQWHYINHANTWQAMPDLLKDARAKALRGAADHLRKRGDEINADGAGPLGISMRAIFYDEANAIDDLLNKDQHQ